MTRGGEGGKKMPGGKGEQKRGGQEEEKPGKAHKLLRGGGGHQRISPLHRAPPVLKPALCEADLLGEAFWGEFPCVNLNDLYLHTYRSECLNLGVSQ